MKKTVKRLHIYLFTLAVVATIIGLWLAGPIPQDPAYHDFADQRTLFGVANFWNVVSNLSMLFLGAYGLWRSLLDWLKRTDLVARLIPITFSIGVLFACVGSAYYHYAPDNLTLVWDRLPMTFMFMPLFALLIYDFIGKKEGGIAYWLLVPLGVFSVFYWRQTEAAGHGDLRFYAFVQFFPMVAAVLLVLVSPQKPIYTRYLLLALGWYVVAKLCEHFDDAIFNTLKFWSGHTLKHLVGSISLFYVLKITDAWRI
ncbi:MAG: hypothetical protein GC192_08560 [Bacteroidetes bacterium]|nr:hypothetical protein [Bacteroidota bacterium]